jgi:hypothetical protein
MIINMQKLPTESHDQPREDMFTTGVPSSEECLNSVSSTGRSDVLPVLPIHRDYNLPTGDFIAVN